jgi:hypothetical protein
MHAFGREDDSEETAPLLKDQDLERLRMEREPCPVCQWQMWEYELILGNETEQHLYICPRCDHTQTKIVPRLRIAS